MKVNFYKQPGGLLTPASDLDVEAMQAFKNGEMYEIEIKRTRNPAFHRKAFVFLTFCFEHYFDIGVNGNVEKFNWFRRELTIAAGYYVEIKTKKGTYKEAKSLAYDKMTPEEFSDWYNAAIQVAMLTIFKGSEDPKIYERLISFFS